MKKLARRIASLVALTLCMLAAPPGFAAGTPWPDAPYNYFADNEKLERVLADFAGGFSLSLSIQPDIQGVVNGKFAAASPTEFLSKLAGMYGFVWYTHAGTLFVSRASDVVTKGVTAPGGNVAALRKALTDLGVLEPRFGWGELGDHGIAVISGPPSYVQLIENTIRSLPARAQQLMVFRLQHASAVDRVVNYRDQQMVTPGLATILRTILAGGSIPLAGPSPAPGGMGAPLRSSVPLGEGANPNGTTTTTNLPPSPPAASVAAARSSGGQGTAPTVQADPRLNAIIVQDVPERLPLYQQLIAQLDIPTALVEIEAMIIDISSDRAKELGVDWTGRIGRTSFSFGDTTTTTNGGRFTFSSGLTAAGNFLISQLRALETRGDAQIQSRPAVLTPENLAALLDLSETFYIRTQGERVANVTPVTAGTTLRVTPHVLQYEGKTLVKLSIDIEDGQISDAQVDSLPIVSRSTVSTEATVQNGEALLIAGYTTDRNTVSRSQLPVLGDIPGVGALFSNRTRNMQKRERVFLIRPQVVGVSGVPVPNAFSPLRTPEPQTSTTPLGAAPAPAPSAAAQAEEKARTLSVAERLWSEFAP